MVYSTERTRHLPIASASLKNVSVPFQVLGEITETSTIAVGRAIRELRRLRKIYGTGRWRKMKGVARIRLPDDTNARAEVHWYEAHGSGGTELKIKRLLPAEES
ncbi:MAG TPA: hypothetical protein VMD75_00695 [Candidatus Binataceae bacterium]|nr:hypothetical protein [Candidatus Binataceae bacterium]